MAAAASTSTCRSMKPGVTETAGAPADISCYLHWGKYGATWSDLAMTWNVPDGNNDEYKATLSQATLNALRRGHVWLHRLLPEGRRGRAVEDGQMRQRPARRRPGRRPDHRDPVRRPQPAPAGGVFVHLFEWKWADIEQECPYLASKGYTAVQVSPPNGAPGAHRRQGGIAANDYPWWVRYQPVSYSLAHQPQRHAGRVPGDGRHACNARRRGHLRGRGDQPHGRDRGSNVRPARARPARSTAASSIPTPARRCTA